MTVSLWPVSQRSGGRGGPWDGSNGWRLTTWNCTSWTWMGWASSVKLWSSQISVAPSAGCSVIGSSQPRWTGCPLASWLPAAERLVGPLVDQVQLGTHRHAGEVHDHVGPLSQAHQQLIELHRSGQ